MLMGMIKDFNSETKGWSAGKGKNGRKMRKWVGKYGKGQKGGFRFGHLPFGKTEPFNRASGGVLNPNI